MKNFYSMLGIGLTLVCSVLVLALLVEIYYLVKLRNQGLTSKKEKEVDKNIQVGAELSKKAMNGNRGSEESIEAELMRLHNLSGPPRFLHTIKEETKEDLESEDAKSRTDSKSKKGSRSRSLSDVMITVDTTTSLPSSPLKSPTLWNPMETYSHFGVNPLFESNGFDIFDRLRSYPPPKFKFLRDAEEKFLRRLVLEEPEKRGFSNCITVQDCLASDEI